MWELRLAPLRERRVDILDWIERLHRRWAGERGAGPMPGLTVDAGLACLRYAWPLNLRSIERLIHELFSGEDLGAEPIAPARLPEWLTSLVSAPTRTERAPVIDTSPASPPTEESDESQDEANNPRARAPVPTRAEFTAAHERLDGSVHALARHFGRDRRQIYRWLATHGLKERPPR